MTNDKISRQVCWIIFINILPLFWKYGKVTNGNLTLWLIKSLIWFEPLMLFISFTAGIVNTIFSVSNSLPTHSLAKYAPCFFHVSYFLAAVSQEYFQHSVFISWNLISLPWDLTLSYVRYTIHKPTVLKLVGSAQFLLPDLRLVADSLLDITLRHAVGTWNWIGVYLNS